MMAIGRYLLLIISSTALTFTVDGSFSKEDIAQFLEYIFRLHNAVRLKHNVPPLTRNVNMDFIASQELKGLVIKSDKVFGVVPNWMYYDNTTQLNVVEAMQFFSLSYELGDFYNYEIEPDNKHADKFTQIVWMDTTDIGIAFRCKQTRYEVLALYYPRGNILKRYTSNVFRPINSLPAIDGLIYQTGKEKFLDCLLQLHNVARTNHSVLPLKHDHKLDDIANSMLRRGTKIPTEEYGVNRLTITYEVHMKLGEEVAMKVFSEWYKGEKFYNYEDESATTYTMYTAEFTQILWQNTQQIGIGIQQSGREYEIIAVYKPPGNIRGQFASNVFRPQSTDQGESSGNNLSISLKND